MGNGDGNGRGTALADASLSNAKRFKNLSFLTMHAYAQYARTAILAEKGEWMGGGVALNWGQMGYFGWFGLEFPFDVVAIAIETVTATETETGCQAELTQLRVLQVSLSLSV